MLEKGESRVLQFQAKGTSLLLAMLGLVNELNLQEVLMNLDDLGLWSALRSQSDVPPFIDSGEMRVGGIAAAA